MKYAVIIGNTRTEYSDFNEAFNAAALAGVTVYTIEDKTPKNIIEDITVESWKLKAVLQLKGIAGAVITAIEQLPEPDKTVAKSAWYDSATISRISKTVTFVQTVIGLTDSQVNDIFIEAKSIEA